MAAAGLAAFAVPGCGPIDGRRQLNICSPAFTLAVHIASVAAWEELLPETSGYAPADITRMDKLAVITQSVLAGTGDLGDGDILSALRAAEAGADLKIVGLAFNSTSLVFVADRERVPAVADLARPDVTVAVNSKGDFTHVLLIQPLRRAGVDPDAVTLVKIGGSGDRVRALQSGKVHAVPVHLDQAFDLAKDGRFHVLIEPWVEYPVFLGEVLFCRSKWLADPVNARALIEVLKATLRGFRRANVDLDWFADRYRTYATREKKERLTNADLRPIWETLRDKVQAWPNNMETLSANAIRELLPVYQRAGAVRGSVDPDKVVDTSYLAIAIRELDAHE